MTLDILTKAWIWLVALSAGSAAVALFVGFGMDRRIAGAAILLLAFFKARAILADYLGLRDAPFWRRGMDFSLGLFCLMLFGLYLAGGTMP